MDARHGEVTVMRTGSIPFLLLVVGAAFGWAVDVSAQGVLIDPAAQFEVGIEAYDKGVELLADQPDRARRAFREAARHLESVAAAGIQNGYLEYNLGNCYLQSGDVGRAILHYRRAQRLIPGDPLLDANLREARSRRVTKIEPEGRSELLRGIFFLHFDTSLANRKRAAIVAFVLIWVLLIARCWWRRRWLSVTAGVAAFLTVSLTASVWWQERQDARHPDGVVTAMDVTAYKGPGTGYQRQFEQPLQPGVEFSLRSRRGDWWNVELPDGHSAWIHAQQAALVPLEAAAQAPA